MSSHARIEGAHRTSPRGAAARSPRLRRKAFLPQLDQAKALMLSSCHDPPRHTRSGDPFEQGGDETPKRPMDVDTDAFKQAMWEGQANILVTVRLRPRLGNERDHEEIVKALDHNLVVVLDSATTPAGPASGSELGGLQSPVRRHTSHPVRKIRQAGVSSAPRRRSREKRFAFDYVFSPEDNQQTVYSHTTKFLIHGVLNGFNATVFAYGCTGAGKTYTMLGTPDQPGIMALTLEDLFQNIARVHADPLANMTYKVTVSFLEVYNENIRDLLAPASSSSEFLDLREDPVKGPVIAGISEIEACNALEVMKLLRKGNKSRSQEATAANAVSSRSHAVLQVLVEQREKTSSIPSNDVELERAEDGADDTVSSVVKFGKLSLVDLAGSERAAVTQNRGQRLLEGANINRSLLALGNCINALSEKGVSASTFVPYRDSKLTRLLKDSLGGNCRTVMIANVSLAAVSFEETLNTLKYANRAKNIKTTVTRNVLNVDHHITQYVGVISGLRDEVAALKKQLVRQQHEFGASPSSPQPCSTNNNNNNDDDSHDGDFASTATVFTAGVPSAEAMQACLRDVRQHIAQYFAERLKLREALLRIDFQISKSSVGTSPEIDAATLEVNQQDDVTVTAATPTPAAFSPETPMETQNSDTSPSNKKARGELETLVSRRKTVIQELTRLERRMEDFRAAILERSTLMEHELFREVLMMEYRIGNLEVDKMELQVAKELRDREIDAMLNLQDSAVGGIHDNAIVGHHQQQHADSTPAKLPLLFPQLSPKLSSAQPPNNTASAAVSGESSQRGSPRRFIDDLCDRLQTLKSSRDTVVPSKQHQQRHPHMSSSSYADPGSSSARKQWGLSLTSTTLPYIRYKKKPPTDDLSSLAIGGLAETSSSVPPTAEVAQKSPPPLSTVTATVSTPSSSATGQYLRVLKHRRKSHHHIVKKTSKQA